MIQLHVGSQILVLPLQEVFGAPNPNGAVVSARRQVLPVTAEIKTGHVPTVALKSTRTRSHEQNWLWRKCSNLSRRGKTTGNKNSNYTGSSKKKVLLFM